MSGNSDQNIVPSEKSRLSRDSTDFIKNEFNLANQSQAVDGRSFQPPQATTIRAEGEKLLEWGKEKYNQGDYQGAIDAYTQALRINPNDTITYCNRGDALSYLGDKQGAINDYTQASKINPNDANAYRGRGFVRAALGDNQGAIDDTQALQINPHYVQA